MNSTKEKVDFNMNSEDGRTSSLYNFEEKDNEACSFKLVANRYESDKMEDAVNVQQLEGAVKPLQAHPEYTENFNNYKVCRVIAPGVKECLILETGEQVKCDKRQKLKEIQENLKKSTLKSENSSSLETNSVVTVLPPSPPPSLSPDISDYSAPMATKPESDFPDGSQPNASSDKENVNSEVSLSPQLSLKDKKSENSPSPSPLQEKRVKANSFNEASDDFSSQDKLSKKVFKITKQHMEDSAVYFGNLRLGRGMNKGCPRSFILGSCPKNKVSAERNLESKNEGLKDKKENQNLEGKNL